MYLPSQRKEKKRAKVEKFTSKMFYLAKTSIIVSSVHG
jgi:hypothetical protein